MSFSLSAQFEQLNTAQKLGIFKFFFFFHFVTIFSSLTSYLLAHPTAQLLFLIVLHNDIKWRKKHSHENGVIFDEVSEQRITNKSKYLYNYSPKLFFSFSEHSLLKIIPTSYQQFEQLLGSTFELFYVFK